MATIGAITGFSAQNAVLAKVWLWQRQGEKLPDASFWVITSKSGEKYCFGDWLNAYLYPQADSKFATLWNYAAGAAKAAGIDPEKLPPVPDMFGNASRCIGTPEFGIPRVPTEHRPQMSLAQILEVFWPVARKIFELPVPETMDEISREEPPLKVEYWPLIASIVAGQFITQAKSVLDPTVAFTIVMESAIAASKINGTPLFAAAPAQEKPST